jgi:hypothetical protein
MNNRIPPPAMVDVYGLQADPEAVARTRARQDAAREAMGTKWIGHKRHSPVVHPFVLARDWDAAIAENEQRQARVVVRHIRRKV